MPKKSERLLLLKGMDYVLRTMAIDGEEDSPEFDEIFELKMDLNDCRFLNCREDIEKNHAMNAMLWRYPNATFRQIVRMDKASFIAILLKIQPHPVFENRSFNKQKPIWIQLMVMLQRVGCYGNGNSVGARARAAGISIGSVCKFTTRVFKAILDLCVEYLKWPDAVARRAMSERMARDHGLPGAVGIVDGTPVIFCQRPKVDGETYFSRKSVYCINLQLICNDRNEITYYIVGWPGSVFDSTVFDSCKIKQTPAEFYSDGEYIMADSGYAADARTCVPYRQPQASIPVNQVFNTLFSSARVKIEHVNGILKSRFSSLKGLSTQIRERKDFKLANEWILVCLILHNMLIAVSDVEWENEEEEEEQDEAVADNDVLFTQQSANARELRARVQTNLLAWHYGN